MDTHRIIFFLKSIYKYFTVNHLNIHKFLYTYLIVNNIFLKIFSFFLSFRYNKLRKRYPILGKTRRNNFYYWALFSYKLIRSFKATKSKFFGFKFTQFYFTPSFKNISKRKLTRYLILKKKKLNLFKRRGDIRRSILFKAGSYSWKKFVFRRKLYKNFFNYKLISTKGVKKKFKFNFTESLLYRKNKSRLKSSYFKKIKRIKKPLNVKHKFNRVFYSNRRIFSTLIINRHLRQYRFNNCFSFLFKKNYKSLLKTFNLNVVNVLIKSRFIFTKQQALFLINNNYVFVNGVNVSNKDFCVNVNDYIQLIVSKPYYYYFKRILSNIRLLKKKTGYRVWRLTRFSFNFYKQSATNIPRWVDKLMYNRLDIPKFLEVDYTVLAVVVLWYPKYFHELDFYTTKYINYFLFRLYTWKYIV